MGSRAAHKNKKHSLNAFILKMHPSKSICIFVTFLHFCCLFWYLHFHLMKMNACSMGSMAAHKNKKHSLNAFILKMHPSKRICIFVTFLHLCCLFWYLHFYLMKMNACSMGSMAAHKNKEHLLNAFILKMHPSNSICSFVTFLHFCCLFLAFFGICIFI